MDSEWVFLKVAAKALYESFLMKKIKEMQSLIKLLKALLKFVT